MEIMVALLVILLAAVTGLYINERIQKNNISRRNKKLKNELRRK